ncbi:caffeoyl-CoA o-methyltransferase [Plakobranchus ocellatus]|uniref:Caffeoyl-CoA o-methyltransferase n=1 Tax=Plakobranchus ocellatus TaxID=259542 RepID=A0AAV4BNU4_9GAST|nr:caffeoyl-CoA o-methyltransferase [Plakobranchus ocellatus]
MSSKKRFEVNRLLGQVIDALEKAEKAGAGPEVIESISAVRDMLQRKDEFTDYASSDHGETCEKIQVETYQHDFQADYDQGKIPSVYEAMMLCGRAEGQFLKSLISIQRAKRVLEVGMFTGYSAAAMAAALPADGELVTLDICESLKTLVQDLIKDFRHAHKIRIEIGPALETMARMADNGEQFDLMFFDGNKKDYIGLFQVLIRYVKMRKIKDYIGLFQMAFDRNLLSPGGTVLIDNAFIMGSAFASPDKSSLAHEIAEAVRNRTDLHSALLPMNDGILMIRRLKDVERDAA